MTEVMRTAWGNPSAPHPQGAAARAPHRDRAPRLLAALGDTGRAGASATSCGRAAAPRPTRSRCSAPRASRAGRDRGVGDRAPGGERGGRARSAKAGARSIEVAPGPDGVLDPDAVAAAATERRGRRDRDGPERDRRSSSRSRRSRARCAARAPGCHIHVDAAQAFGKVPLDVVALGADSVALAGHKLHGPKGVGALWLRAGVTLEPLWVGGGQQRGLRGGTQDAPGAAGLGLAAERAVARAAVGARALARARGARSRRSSTSAASPFRQLVPDQRRAPHILALGIPGVPAAALRTVLASRGVYISTGSACADRDSKPSPVLVAIGLPADVGMVRLSFGIETTAAEVETAARILAEVAPRAG